jgi:Uma2 family endonuclease
MNYALHDRTPEYKVRRTVPLLESGDRLNQREFHNLYEQMPEVKKAELVDGVVFVSSPASLAHSDRVAWITGCLVAYTAGLKGVRVGNSASIIVDDDNEFQPDALLFFDQAAGGQAHPCGEYLKGVPEVAVEVSYSSRAYDLHQKLRVYERHGVKEYLVWDVSKDKFHVFRQNEGSFLELPPNDTFKSVVFPGLWLNLEALARGDLASALKTIESGKRSTEFKKFAASLRKRGGGTKK